MISVKPFIKWAEWKDSVNTCTVELLIPQDLNNTDSFTYRALC